MALFLMHLIRLYWRFVPEARRRHCLFRETCSRYVYREIESNGTLKGLRALWDRICACRPGFQLRVHQHRFEIVCRNGATIQDGDFGAIVLAALSPHRQVSAHCAAETTSPNWP